MARRKSLTSHFTTGKKTSAKRRPTRQTLPIPGEESRQVLNNAGGFVYQVDAFERLARFLVLGAEGGTYYQSEKDLTVKNGNNVLGCLKADGDTGDRTVSTIIDFWNNDRAPKPNPIMFALALAATKGGIANRALLRNKFNETVRTGYHLFRFIHYVNEFRGWGRYLKNLVRDWYVRKTPAQVAFQAAKYQQREGWSHRDVLRLAHVKSPAHNMVFKTIVGKADASELVQPFAAINELNKSKDPVKAVAAIKEFRLTHEMLPTELKNFVPVWEALLENMPLTALIRNLGAMGARKVIAPGKFKRNVEIAARLTNVDELRKARIHPIQILSALKVYGQGHGERGSLSWEPAAEITAALDEAFVKSFKLVEPTNKRFLLGIDVSGSMCGGDIAGVPGLSPREAASAMAVTTVRTEPYCVTTAFQDQLVPLHIDSRSTVDSVVRKTRGLPFGGTDCAQPMLYALKNKLDIDVFVVYTDSETWAGNIHPKQALAKYRKERNPNAKLIVVAFTASEFSIADPEDRGMLDVVGFDSGALQAIREFITA